MARERVGDARAEHHITEVVEVDDQNLHGRADLIPECADTPETACRGGSFDSWS